MSRGRGNLRSCFWSRFVVNDLTEYSKISLFRPPHMSSFTSMSCSRGSRPQQAGREARALSRPARPNTGDVLTMFGGGRSNAGHKQALGRPKTIFFMFTKLSGAWKPWRAAAGPNQLIFGIYGHLANNKQGYIADLKFVGFWQVFCRTKAEII